MCILYNTFPLNISCLFAVLIEAFSMIFTSYRLVIIIIKKNIVFQVKLAEVINVCTLKDNVNTKWKLYKKKVEEEEEEPINL